MQRQCAQPNSMPDNNTSLTIGSSLSVRRKSRCKTIIFLKTVPIHVNTEQNKNLLLTSLHAPIHQSIDNCICTAIPTLTHCIHIYIPYIKSILQIINTAVVVQKATITHQLAILHEGSDC